MICPKVRETGSTLRGQPNENQEVSTPSRRDGAINLLRTEVLPPASFDGGTLKERGGVLFLEVCFLNGG